MILPQSPTKAPKCRQKAANYRGMQVCALFRLGIHHCKSVKLINLLTCTRWPVLFASPRDAPATYNFLHYGSIVFVSLELPGEGSVSRRNSRLSQPDTVSSFETVGSIVSQPLEFRLGGSQLPGSNGIGKSAGLMRAIAERLVCGVPTTAEPNGGPTSQAKGFSLGIKNFEIAFHADGSIVIDSNFRGHHFLSWTTGSMPIPPCSDKRNAIQISAEESVFWNGRINLVGPRKDAAFQVEDFAETRLTQEVHCFGGTLPAAAMRHDFPR